MRRPHECIRTAGSKSDSRRSAFAATSVWRLIILAENVPLTISYAASASPLYQATTVRMTGGIETNSPLIFPASPQLFDIYLETDSRGLIRMTPRLAWVETYLTGKL